MIWRTFSWVDLMKSALHFPLEGIQQFSYPDADLFSLLKQAQRLSCSGMRGPVNKWTARHKITVIP